MQDTRTNRLATAETLEELKAQVPVEDRGPVFALNEIVNLKGYLYKILHIQKEGLFLVPQGKAPQSNRARRRARKKRGGK